MNDDCEVFRRLRAGTPAFLLLGQYEWTKETGLDPLLSLMTKHLGVSKSESTPPTYSGVFCPNGRSIDMEAIGWLASQLSSLPMPQALHSISQYAWNGVFTSLLDSRLNSAFRRSMRDIQPIYSPSINPLRSRSRTRLCIHYLFGAIDRTEKDELVPTSKFEFVARRLASNQLLARVQSQVTPLGTLFIEGFDAKDWVATEDLYAVLRNLSKHQAFLFAPKDDLLSDSFVQELVRSEILSIVPQSLAAVLDEARARGILESELRVDEAEGPAVFINGQLAEVPKDLYFRLSESTRLIESRNLTSASELSVEGRYAAFRAFLGESTTAAIWEAFPRKLAFERDYWRLLRDEVDGVTSNAGVDAPTVLLHGQSGSGKTVALNWLAYTLSAERVVPVIFVERFGPRPEYNDIDEFCRWAEDIGAACTVIIWDGMLDPDAYLQARRVLASRGRRIALIGSSYRLPKRVPGAARMIEAPSTLSQREIANFPSFLESVDVEIAEAFRKSPSRFDESFLVALYRLLPPTRSQLRSGLAREAATAEKTLSVSVVKASPVAPQTALAIAFLAAGLSKSEATAADGAIESESSAGKLIGFVMVPGRLGLAVPFDLVLRAAGAQAIESALRLLRETDLFRWHEDVAGAIWLAPRHSLEAVLICQSRIGGAANEVDIATQLICGARSNAPEGVDPEVDFVVHLASGLGPNGPEGSRYCEYYNDLSNSLCRLREQQSVVSSRLMLQEASLLREWVSLKGKYLAVEAIDEALKKAESVLREGLAQIGDSRTNLRHRSNLLVELASILGTRATKESESGGDANQVVTLFQEVRRTALRARSLDPGHHHPIDVELWVARNILKRGELTKEMRLEVGADVLEAFDIINETELDSRTSERFLSLKQELGPLLEMSDIEGEAFDKLVRAGSAVGYFIRAQAMLGSALLAPSKAESVEAATKARDYLLLNYTAIARDGRCLRLLIRCWWISKTGKALFGGERQPLPLSDEMSRACLGLIEELFKIGPEYRDIQLRYLHAVLLWQCREFESALREWRELQLDSDYSLGARRVVKSHLATSADGVPVEYHGTVSFLNSAGTRGKVMVEEIRQAIDFFPKDFGMQVVRRGQPIGPFHIAFNFIAPVADPMRHYRV